MALFIYDSAEREAVMPDLQEVRKHCRDLTVCGVEAHGIRTAVRTLMNHKLLVVPTSVEHCTPVVERMKLIAHTSGIDVRTLAAHISRSRNTVLRRAHERTTAPVAAVAVPPTQQPAAAGQPLAACAS